MIRAQSGIFLVQVCAQKEDGDALGRYQGVCYQHLISSRDAHKKKSIATYNTETRNRQPRRYEKAVRARQQIENEYLQTGQLPIVFSTLVIPELVMIIREAKALHLDVIQTFVEPLKRELGIAPKREIGLSHQNMESQEYKDRIEAINFTLAHDDGQSNRNLDEADVILVGVSRSGKTPTSLYLAMQYGLKVANYPLIPEDFERGQLPASLMPYKHKLFGLTIQPERLAEVRNERRPNSKYASLQNCRYEVTEAEAMMNLEKIPYLSSTSKSIEEISTAILSDMRTSSGQRP